MYEVYNVQCAIVSDILVFGYYLQYLFFICKHVCIIFL